jgi:hypothetical protein
MDIREVIATATSILVSDLMSGNLTDVNEIARRVGLILSATEKVGFESALAMVAANDNLPTAQPSTLN